MGEKKRCEGRELSGASLWTLRVLLASTGSLLLCRLLRVILPWHTWWLLPSLFLSLLLPLLSNPRHSRLPRGPPAFPLIGNMLQLATGSLDGRLQKWRLQYGEIFTVWIGPIPLVMVCSFSLMKKLFVHRSHYFSNRWRNHVTHTFMVLIFRVVTSEWFKSTATDGENNDDFLFIFFAISATQLTDFLEREGRGGTAICTSSPLAVAVGNVINSILFGMTFPQGSAEMERLHRLLECQSKLVIHPLMGLFIAAPWTTHLPLINRPWKQLLVNREAMWSFLATQIQDHKKRSESGEAVTDFTFAYLDEIKRRRDQREDPGSFSEWQLQMLLLDLFFAGMETTVTTLKWALLLMVLHEDVQEKVQEELDSLPVLTVTLAYRNNLPYTIATIWEIQRIANILPINLLRTTAEDVMEGEFFFPSGTLVIPQISVLLNDPSVWGESAASFDPSRFLDDEGRLRKPVEFVPFSLGKRQCLGESLARAELFLLFANLLKRLRLRPSLEDPVPSRKRCLGLTSSPLPFSLRVFPRNCFDTNHNCLGENQ